MSLWPKTGKFEPKILNVQQLIIMTQYKGLPWSMLTAEETRISKTNGPNHMDFTFFAESSWISVSDIQTNACYNITINCLFLNCWLILIFRLPESPWRCQDKILQIWVCATFAPLLREENRLGIYQYNNILYFPNILFFILSSITVYIQYCISFSCTA